MDPPTPADNWAPPTDNGAGTGSAWGNSPNQPFASDSATFGLATGASSTHPRTLLSTVDEDLSDYESENGRYSTTTHLTPRTARSRRPSVPADNEEEEMTTEQAIIGLFREQLKFNKRTANRGSSIPVQLPIFHGRANENVETWIFQMEHVFQAKKIRNNEEGISYIAASLKEAALHLYRNQYTMGRIPFTTVEQFAIAINRAFQPPHYQQILR